MTRKHFVAMAQQIRESLTGIQAPTSADYARALHTANAFATLALAHNPRFNRERFIAACGLGGKTL